MELVFAVCCFVFPVWALSLQSYEGDHEDDFDFLWKLWLDTAIKILLSLQINGLLHGGILVFKKGAIPSMRIPPFAVIAVNREPRHQWRHPLARPRWLLVFFVLHQRRVSSWSERIERLWTVSWSTRCFQQSLLFVPGDSPTNTPFWDRVVGVCYVWGGCCREIDGDTINAPCFPPMGFVWLSALSDRASGLPTSNPLNGLIKPVHPFVEASVWPRDHSWVSPSWTPCDGFQL